MNKKLTPNQKDVIDTIVVIMLAIIAALVALCLTFATGKADTESISMKGSKLPDCMTKGHMSAVALQNKSVKVDKMTGGAFGHPACVKGNGTPVEKKPVQKRTVANTGSVEPTVDNTPVVEPPVIVNPDNPAPEPKEDKVKCNNGFGNGPDTACKTHGNAQNQDNTGTHQDGKDMSKGDNNQP